MLPLGHQSFVELFHHRIVLNGTEHGHIEHGAYRGSAASYPPFASHLAAVSIEGCQASQGGNLSVTEPAQLG